MKKDKSLIMVKKIISNFIDLNRYQLFVFGSRAKGTARKFSDYDVGIAGRKEVSFKKLALIKEALEDSDLPYSIDVVDLVSTSREFKKIALSGAQKL